MDNKLILCVSVFPELHTTTLKSYHNLGRRTVAWLNDSSQTRQPGVGTGSLNDIVFVLVIFCFGSGVIILLLLIRPAGVISNQH